MKSLRDYQQTASDFIVGQVNEPGIPTVVSPVGSGKTLIGVKTAERLIASGLKVWIVVPSLRLLSDAKKEIQESCPTLQPSHKMVSYLAAQGGAYSPRTPLVLVMEQTASRRLKDFKNDDWIPDVIIFDEAHRTQFSAIGRFARSNWKKTKIVGMTGTPYRMSGLPYIDVSPQDLWIETTNPRKQIAEGLCKRTRWVLPSEALLLEIHEKLAEIPVGADGELETRSHAKAMIEMFPLQFAEYRKHNVDPKRVTFWFCVSKKHAEFVTKELSAAGYAADVITEATPQKNRDRILDAAQAGELLHVVSVGCLAIGINVPRASCGVWLRSIGSPGFWQQTWGRIVRKHEEFPEAIGFDFGLNIAKHQLPENIDWLDILDKRQVKDHAHALCASCLHDAISIPRPEGLVIATGCDKSTGAQYEATTAIACPNCGAPAFYDPEQFQQWAEWQKEPAMERAPFDGHRGVSLGDRRDDPRYEDCTEPLTVEVLYGAGVWCLSEAIADEVVESIRDSKLGLLQDAQNVIDRQEQAMFRLNQLSAPVQKYVLSSCTSKAQVLAVADPAIRARTALVYCYFWNKNVRDLRNLAGVGTAIAEDEFLSQVSLCLENLTRGCPSAFDGLSQWVVKLTGKATAIEFKRHVVAVLQSLKNQGLKVA